MNISECNIGEYMGNMCGKMRNQWDTLLGCVSKETMCNSSRQIISTAGQACGLSKTYSNIKPKKIAY